MQAAIEIQDLRVDYGTLTAVDNLSLSIGTGEIYGLVGPNGAGKTSTLNVLATLLVPTYGHIRMAGFELDEEPAAIRARLGYMPDLAPVIGNLKVWEFLDLFAAAHGLDGATRRKRVNQCLELVDMEGSRDTLCETLSRGMSQRVVLAKTLLHEPEILLLDEPASGMDPIARIKLKDALQAVAAEGATIIISSHILSELSEMATSIGILHKGKLREHGSVEEVLASIEQATSRIRVDVLGEPESCLAWLENRGITAAITGKESRHLEVELPGNKRRQAELLLQLVEAGFAVYGFQARRSSLEDLMRSISEDSAEPAGLQSEERSDDH
jgi:ABC-2 type transport system ATP-binding protein